MKKHGDNGKEEDCDAKQTGCGKKDNIVNNVMNDYDGDAKDSDAKKQCVAKKSTITGILI